MAFDSPPVLKRVLAAFSTVATLTPPREPVETKHAGIAIRRTFSGLAPAEPERYALQATYRAVTEVFHDQGELTSLAKVHLKRGAWILLSAVDDKSIPLTEIDGCLEAYLNEVSRRMPASAIQGLAVVFLRLYPRQASYFEYLRRRIAKLVDMGRGIHLDALRTRSQTYGLFAQDGPAQFGERLYAAQEPLALMERAGLVGPLAERGFVELAVGRMMDHVSRSLTMPNGIEQGVTRWIGFFAGERSGGEGQLRFPGARIAIAEGFLRPFAQAEPPATLRHVLQSFLVDHYGDPRIRMTHWQGVGDDALGVMRSWLVESTLGDFFQLVREASTHDPDADRMWPYREAFWRAYLTRGVINEAWVVLGDDIATHAVAFLEGQGNAYGRLQHGGLARKTHAVLIMRIGDLVISEWSHTGKYRVWHDDNASAPRFYKQHYSRKDVTSNPDFDGSHHGARKGTWQAKLADLVMDWTSITVSQKEYMPND